MLNSDGDALLPKPLAELQSSKVSDAKQTSASMLSGTDWYVVRKTETGVAIPEEITAYRTAVRTNYASLKTAINNVSDIAGLQALYETTAGASSTAKEIDATSSSVVSTTNNTITSNGHGFVDDEQVYYYVGLNSDDEVAAVIGGIKDQSVYFIHSATTNKFKLSESHSDCEEAAVESLTGLSSDGTRQTFNVGYPFNEIPTVELNTGSGYVAQTVGIRGIDTGQQWYIALASTELVQEFTDTAIGSSNSLRVTYKGQYQLVALARDDAEVSRIAALEGGSTTGYVDAATTQSGIKGSEAAIDVAASYLDRFAQTSTLLSFTTTKNSPERLRAGQVLDFELVDQDISGIFLIDQIRIRFRNGITFYDVKCVASPPEYTFESFIRDMDDKISDAFIEISENIDTEEVLVVRADGGTETASISEVDVETVLACPLPSNSTFVSGSLVVC